MDDDKFECDCCSVMLDGVWAFLHGEFSYYAGGKRIKAEAGFFGLCDTCAAPMQRGDVTGLLRIGLKAHADKRIPEARLTEFLLPLYAGVIEHRHGAPRWLASQAESDKLVEELKIRRE